MVSFWRLDTRLRLAQRLRGVPLPPDDDLIEIANDTKDLSNKMKKACMRVDGNVWTLTYIDHPDMSIDIIDFNNEDNDGYIFGDNLPKLDRIVEDNNRVALEARIDGSDYRIRNQQNIFTYKLPL